MKSRIEIRGNKSGRPGWGETVNINKEWFEQVFKIIIGIAREFTKNHNLPRGLQVNDLVQDGVIEVLELLNKKSVLNYAKNNRLPLDAPILKTYIRKAVRGVIKDKISIEKRGGIIKLKRNVTPLIVQFNENLHIEREMRPPLFDDFECDDFNYEKEIIVINEIPDYRKIEEPFTFERADDWGFMEDGDDEEYGAERERHDIRLKREKEEYLLFLKIDMEKALGHLKSDGRKVVELHHREDLKFATIAMIFEKSEKTVRTLHKEGIEQLRKILSPYILPDFSPSSSIVYKKDEIFLGPKGQIILKEGRISANNP